MTNPDPIPAIEVVFCPPEQSREKSFPRQVGPGTLSLTGPTCELKGLTAGWLLPGAGVC